MDAMPRQELNNGLGVDARKDLMFKTTEDFTDIMV